MRPQTSSQRILDEDPQWTAEEWAEARELASSLSADEKNELLRPVSSDRVHVFIWRGRPLHYVPPTYKAETGWVQAHEGGIPTAAQIQESLEALVVAELLPHVRRRAEQAAIDDPAASEAQRVWLEYCGQIQAVVNGQGTTADAWLARWRELVDERRALEKFGGPTDLTDARLEELVGVPYPGSARPAEPAPASTARRSRKAAER